MRIIRNLLIMYNRFSGLYKFWFSERITENTVSHLNFNEESDYSEESTCDNEDFRSTIFHHRKKLNISWRFNGRFITYIIRIGNLDWCKCGHCNNEAREIDCLCWREMGAMLTASAKITQREGSISPRNFMGICRILRHTC